MRRFSSLFAGVTLVAAGVLGAAFAASAAEVKLTPAFAQVPCSEFTAEVVIDGQGANTSYYNAQVNFQPNRVEFVGITGPLGGPFVDAGGASLAVNALRAAEGEVRFAGVEDGLVGPAGATVARLTFRVLEGFEGEAPIALTVYQLVDNRAQEVPVSQVHSAIVESIEPVSFADVPTSHMFHRYITPFAAAGISTGCAANPLRFCPDTATTRGQMAVFMVRGLAKEADASAGSPFTDVPETHPFHGFIRVFGDLGITAGCGPNLFCPDGIVTRGQMAVFMIRALGLEPDQTPGSPFGDVGSSHPFRRWIKRFATLGITGGCSASPPLFCPDNPVTRGQMAVFMSRAFGAIGLGACDSRFSGLTDDGAADELLPDEQFLEGEAYRLAHGAESDLPSYSFEVDGEVVVDGETSEPAAVEGDEPTSGRSRQSSKRDGSSRTR